MYQQDSAKSFFFVFDQIISSTIFVNIFIVETMAMSFNNAIVEQ